MSQLKHRWIFHTVSPWLWVCNAFLYSSSHLRGTPMLPALAPSNSQSKNSTDPYWVPSNFSDWLFLSHSAKTVHAVLYQGVFQSTLEALPFKHQVFHSHLLLHAFLLHSQRILWRMLGQQFAPGVKCGNAVKARSCHLFHLKVIHPLVRSLSTNQNAPQSLRLLE